MLKKMIKRGIAIIGACILTFGAVGCDCKSEESEYDIWTTYNTMKVVREADLNDNYVKMEKGINVKMAKGESEMGSVYITTGEEGVDKFNFVVQDLKNENGDVLSIENMDVYAQKYIEIIWRSRNNTYEEYPLGSHAPDALVEMDLYKRAGENSILPNSNQGFTVDFKANADTPTGVYTGIFYLVLDGDVQEIPVSVTVWDYAIPAKATAASCLLIYEDSIKQGEMTSVQAEVDDWYRTYYELALEYRINPYMVPESTKSPEKFVENVIKYFDHPNFTTFGLPHQSFLGAYAGSYQSDAGFFDDDNGTKKSRYGDCMNYWYDCIYLLGRKAKETGVNYFEKCYIYPIDEPNGPEQLAIAIEWMQDLKQFRNDVADALVRNGVLDADSPIVASVRDIDIICTALGDEPALAEFDIVYVPEPYEIEDYSIQTNIEKHAENNDNPIWYYTQIDKIGDGPNLFIDDFGVAGRVQGWMEKYYNIDSWLYWEFAMYLSKIAFQSGYKVVNPYQDMSRDSGSATGCAGGGYFVYPASRYGADEPIKTLRLLTLRDSYEDKEVLTYLDNVYSEYEKYYGLETGTLDINKVFKGVYDSIFCRSAVFRDDQVFDGCREVLKDTVINANKADNKFVYTMDYVGKNATYSFYTAPGYQVKVGDKVLESTASGEGLKHTYTIDASTTAVLESVELVKDGQSTVMDLYEVSTEKAVDMHASDFKVQVSTGSEVTKDGNNFNFVVRSNESDQYFLPQIKFTGVPSKFKVVEIDIENTTDVAVDMYLRICYTDGTSEMKDIGLTENTARTVEVLSRTKTEKEISYIAIRFDNTKEVDGNIEVIGDRTITVSGIRVR